MKIYDFRIEYREEPKGLAVRIPRFSWKIASDEKNVAQASWQIIVDCDGSCVWDSGKVESDQSVLVPYGGLELEEQIVT